jgi:hypothetical protein
MQMGFYAKKHRRKWRNLSSSTTQRICPKNWLKAFDWFSFKIKEACKGNYAATQLTSCRRTYMQDKENLKENPNMKQHMWRSRKVTS